MTADTITLTREALYTALHKKLDDADIEAAWESLQTAALEDGGEVAPGESIDGLGRRMASLGVDTLTLRHNGLGDFTAEAAGNDAQGGPWTEDLIGAQPSEGHASTVNDDNGYRLGLANAVSEILARVSPAAAPASGRTTRPSAREWAKAKGIPEPSQSEQQAALARETRVVLPDIEDRSHFDDGMDDDEPDDLGHVWYVGGLSDGFCKRCGWLKGTSRSRNQCDPEGVNLRASKPDPEAQISVAGVGTFTAGEAHGDEEAGPHRHRSGKRQAAPGNAAGGAFWADRYLHARDELEAARRDAVAITKANHQLEEQRQAAHARAEQAERERDEARALLMEPVAELTAEEGAREERGEAEAALEDMAVSVLRLFSRPNFPFKTKTRKAVLEHLPDDAARGRVMARVGVVETSDD